MAANSSERSKNACNKIHLMINCQNEILMQQHKFACNVKYVNSMRIL